MNICSEVDIVEYALMVTDDSSVSWSGVTQEEQPRLSRG